MQRPRAQLITMMWLACSLACHPTAAESSAGQSVEAPVQAGAETASGGAEPAAVVHACCGSEDRSRGDKHPILTPLPFPRTQLALPEAIGPDDPDGCVVRYEPFGPAPTSTEAQLEQFSEAITTIYLSPQSTAWQIEEAREFLASQDPATVVPAWFNALIGLDLRAADGAQTASHIVFGFHESTAGVPRFFLDPRDGVNPYNVSFLSLRIARVGHFHGWWAGYDDGSAPFASYQEKVRRNLAAHQNRIDAQRQETR